MRMVNEAVRFILELAALSALGWWGWNLESPTAVRLLAAVGTPLVVAVGWARYVAPQSAQRLDDPWRLAVEVLIFGAAVGALAAVGRTRIALVFAAVVVLSLVMMFVLDQR